MTPRPPSCQRRQRGGPVPEASMSTRAASSTGALPMSMSGPGVRLCRVATCTTMVCWHLGAADIFRGPDAVCNGKCWEAPLHKIGLSVGFVYRTAR